MGPPPGSQVAPLPSNLPFRLISKTIGQGAYASIRKAAPLNAPRPIIAIKFINKEHAFRQGRLRPKQIALEISLHMHVSHHQNIIRCLSSGEDNLWTWIAMELAEGGDLFDKIEADEGVGEDVAHFYFTQLVQGVSYMHSMGVAHRDIKPENMLLSSEGDLKIADFGLAELFYDQNSGRTKMSTMICGSPPYIAPELIEVGNANMRRKDKSQEKASYAANVSDIWSCGIVLFVLLVGNTPWDEPTRNSYEFNEFVETMGRTTDELWAKIPPEIMSLLRGILKTDPRERFTLEEVRMHPWFTRHNPYLSPKGTVANPVRLATTMLESLRIDFSSHSTSSHRTHRHTEDAMDPDHKPNAWAAKFASTQPETPIADMAFDWERPPRIAAHAGFSASQPTTNISAHATISSSLLDQLSDDPSMSQFSQTPQVPLLLTQQARKFRDIVPAHSLARFLSPLPFHLLLPLLVEALHHLKIPVPPLPQSALDGGEETAYVRVKTVDGRRQGLNGNIVVERLNAEMLEARFVKAKGDPLEWRRFFKKVVVLCKDGILVPQH
ncbi:kinase-like domain-containing protein [Cryomyces antarcticus]